MRVRKIDGNNDWCFGNGNNDYATEAYAVGLDIKLRLQEWFNDCFFALDSGIDWRHRLGDYNQKLFLDGDVRTIAMTTNGVLDIADFQSRVDNRRYTCSFNVYQQFSLDIVPVEFEIGV